MTTLEKKIDLALRWIVADRRDEKFDIELEIMDILQAEPSEPVTVSMDDMINSFLLELGIPAHLKGFQYIACAVQLAVNDRNKYMENVTKVLYPTVAKQYDTTALRAERAIRHAIEVACDNGLSVCYENLFANQINPDKGKPTNSAFIASCAMEIKRRMKEVRG